METVSAPAGYKLEVGEVCLDEEVRFAPTRHGQQV